MMTGSLCTPCPPLAQDSLVGNWGFSNQPQLSDGRLKGAANSDLQYHIPCQTLHKHLSERRRHAGELARPEECGPPGAAGRCLCRVATLHKARHARRALVHIAGPAGEQACGSLSCCATIRQQRHANCQSRHQMQDVDLAKCRSRPAHQVTLGPRSSSRRLTVCQLKRVSSAKPNSGCSAASSHAFVLGSAGTFELP